MPGLVMGETIYTVHQEFSWIMEFQVTFWLYMQNKLTICKMHNNASIAVSMQNLLISSLSTAYATGKALGKVLPTTYSVNMTTPIHSPMCLVWMSRGTVGG